LTEICTVDKSFPCWTGGWYGNPLCGLLSAIGLFVIV
jgi:hypothetical protein